MGNNKGQTPFRTAMHERGSDPYFIFYLEGVLFLGHE